MKFQKDKKYSRVPKRIWYLIIAIIAVFIVGSILVRNYYYGLLKPLSSSQRVISVDISKGSSVREISDQLASSHLIRSSWAAQLYINSKNLSNSLQAGTYSFSPSESTQYIISAIAEGKIASNLVTILPGTNIFKLKTDLLKDGYSQSTINNALNIANYRKLKIMQFVPSNVNTIEGLLWPDSFQRNKDTPLSDIITESLNEMANHLTPNVQAAFASEGLSTYQGLILASIIDQEVSKPSDQAQVAQVFLSRLKQSMNLGSDVTAYYGSLANNQTPNLNFDSPYNTLLHPGLPPTPISTINSTSLYAATHPAPTNWLYFVTGDNGVTYFSNTLAQQQANTAQYCHKLCGN